METELKELWEKTLNIIKGELTEVSFNTWIKSCEPICISANTIKISVPNSFTQDILEKRYKDLVINSIVFFGWYVMNIRNTPPLSDLFYSKNYTSQIKVTLLLYIFTFLLSILIKLRKTVDKVIHSLKFVDNLLITHIDL